MTAREHGPVLLGSFVGFGVAAKTGTPRRIMEGKAVDDGLTVAVVEVDGRVLGVAAVVLEGQTGSTSAAPLIGRFVRALVR